MPQISRRSMTNILQPIEELSTTSSSGNEQELQEQVKALQIANAKAEYRIKMLLRTLEEKDKKQ